MTDETPAKKSSILLPWVLLALAVGASLLVVLLGLLPAQKQVGRTGAESARLKKALAASESAAEAERKQVQALLKDKSGLDEENTATKEKLQEALDAKEKALADLEQAKKDLSATLVTQIAAGDVLIKEVNGELVVDVDDKLLFDVGAAEINEAGQKLLLEVAKSMKRLSQQQVFQVGGHTDSQAVVSKELTERYPTNWELGASRATQVVRFLQERGAVPGRQLIAASFSQYRPASSNKTTSGRQKNRRIEIVLLRKKR